jgi:hypothetical protein
MTPRQARTERRAAERKAKKIARKATQHLAADASYVPQPGDASNGFVSQSTTAAPARTEINRANAQLSTGPRTPAGKLASSRNSLKHGLASAQLIIPGEDPAAFDALFSALLDEHQPANATEDLLVQQIAQAYWLTQRAIRFQNECFSTEGVDEKRLSLLLRYQTTYERAFHKGLTALIKLKKDRAPGFVSQTKSHSGFVSQNGYEHPAPNQFVMQNAGFVSQENPRQETRARLGQA